MREDNVGRMLTAGKLVSYFDLDSLPDQRRLQNLELVLFKDGQIQGMPPSLRRQKRSDSGEPPLALLPTDGADLLPLHFSTLSFQPVDEIGG